MFMVEKKQPVKSGAIPASPGVKWLLTGFGYFVALKVLTRVAEKISWKYI